MNRRAIGGGAIAVVIAIAIVVLIMSGGETPRDAETETETEIEAGTAAETGTEAASGAASAPGAAAPGPGPESDPAPRTTAGSAPAPGAAAPAVTSGRAAPPPTPITPIAPRSTDDEPRPPATGRIAPERIRDAVREAIPQLQFCFEWQLERRPELAGRVTLEFRITEDGSVADASIAEDLLEDEVVLRCFRGVFGRMHFDPPPEGGDVLVRYPIAAAADPEPEGI